MLAQVVGEYDFEKAEHYCTQLTENGLTADVRPAETKGAGGKSSFASLSVTYCL